jgi:hypothetical protein
MFPLQVINFPRSFPVTSEAIDLLRGMSFHIDIVRKKIGRRKGLSNVIGRTNYAKRERLEPRIIRGKLIARSLFLELRDPNSAPSHVGLEGPDRSPRRFKFGTHA